MKRVLGGFLYPAGHAAVHVERHDRAVDPQKRRRTRRHVHVARALLDHGAEQLVEIDLDTFLRLGHARLVLRVGTARAMIPEHNGQVSVSGGLAWRTTWPCHEPDS